MNIENGVDVLATGTGRDNWYFRTDVLQSYVIYAMLLLRKKKKRINKSFMLFTLFYADKRFKFQASPCTVSSEKLSSSSSSSSIP